MKYKCDMNIRGADKEAAAWDACTPSLGAWAGAPPPLLCTLGAAGDRSATWVPATQAGNPDESLALSFSLASPGYCGCLGSEPAGGRHHSFSLLSK